jgi:hypothetical protein
MANRLGEQTHNDNSAGWASIVGQQCLVKAQEMRLSAVKNSMSAQSPEGTIQLPKEVVAEVAGLHMDAVAILHLGNRFFRAALGDKPEMLGTLPRSSAQHLHHILMVVLGFALRHTCGT